MVGGPFELHGGLWFQVVIGGVAGDCNLDGVINVADHVCFAPCMGGPITLVPSECDPWDYDEDGDVDLADWAEFVEILGSAP